MNNRDLEQVRECCRCSQRQTGGQRRGGAWNRRRSSTRARAFNELRPPGSRRRLTRRQRGSPRLLRHDRSPNRLLGVPDAELTVAYVGPCTRTNHRAHFARGLGRADRRRLRPSSAGSGDRGPEWLSCLLLALLAGRRGSTSARQAVVHFFARRVRNTLAGINRPTAGTRAEGRGRRARRVVPRR